jgi:hypothetical protein
VLELGVVVHSLIIGMSLGASDFPSTVRPLVPALTFHQFFEGIGLGGCIVQVRTLFASDLVWFRSSQFASLSTKLLHQWRRSGPLGFSTLRNLPTNQSCKHCQGKTSSHHLEH